jgi:uncharacterized protein
MTSMAPDPRQFTPAPLLRNPHLMTIAPSYWPRRALLAGIPTESRLFTTEPPTQLLGHCHWQPDRTACRSVVLVHGLEGCSESHYMQGIASKAYRAGMNVIRLNQRTCGGTEHLTPTLYNSGLSQDYRTVVHELARVDGLTRIWLVGYSMGGNLVLKTAGEAGSSDGALAGAIAVCPNIDPTQCAKALEEPRNWLYHYHFLTRLKARMRRKAALFPGKWNLTGLDRIRTISEFDDRYTAPDGGYASGADYYDRAGARHVLEKIAMPTIIIAAQDDPFIPCSMFSLAAIYQNPHIRLTAPQCGGHCGFLQRGRQDEDRFWVENRIIESMRVSGEGAVPLPRQ